MKMKTIMATLMVSALAIGGTTTAFASSAGTGNALDQISVKLQKYAYGEMPEIPDGATKLDKEVSNEISNSIKTSAAGEFQEITDGTVILYKEVAER